jgi:hypothetical protein
MLSKRVKLWVCVFAALSLVLLTVACGGGGDDDVAEDEGTTGAPTGTPYQTTGNEGTVTGKVVLNGTAPAPQAIDMNADAACASKNPNAVAETAVVKDGKVKYVFVYVKDGTTADSKKLTSFSFPVPSDPVTLDQNGCHYVPHVLGIQANQKFLVTNSDPTAHNVNVQGKGNPPWNTSQPPSAPPIEQKFPRAEVLIPVKCNQHPWMKSYIGVMNNPFYAVTAEDGSFTIKGLPPGKYTVVAWHERFGEKTMEVNLAAKGNAVADFAFDSATASDSIRSTTMEVLPAIEFPMLMRH